MRTRIFLVLIWVIEAGAGYAQDIHFSQYYASPLNLNPALTGFLEGDARVIANYRNQWSSITASPYVTASFSLDMALFRNKLGTDWVGFGLVVMNDRAGSGSLSNLKLMLSGSYIKQLNKNNFLSFGIQVGLVQRRIDFLELTFDNQYTSSGFDPLAPTGEIFRNTDFMYLDTQTGLFWFYTPDDKFKIFNGLSIFHLFSPIETFLGDYNKLSPKISLYSGAEVTFKRKWEFIPALMFNLQNGAQELILGGSLGYNFMEGFKEDGIVYAGLYYRNADAVVITFAIEYQAYKFGVSFDTNISSLRTASKGSGAPELSFRYEKPIPDNRFKGKVNCPRF